ncbi:zinc ribbon domain-containing protein [bacterium]|nr:MAG: zinc ribbon domain-containing protein [bacterium]
MTARCSKCGTENPADSRFCRSCGKKFVAIAAPVETGEPGVYFCYKHKKETTRVTCGRCERPLCTRCVTVGANGVRCRECARNRVPMHFGGMVHEVSSSLRRIGRSLIARPYWFYIIAFLAISLFGPIRMCGRPHASMPIEEDMESYEPSGDTAPANR